MLRRNDVHVLVVILVERLVIYARISWIHGGDGGAGCVGVSLVHAAVGGGSGGVQGII